MAKHDRFKAYWKSIGKPKIEMKSSIFEWVNILADGYWEGLDYRIKDDPHWQLRRKWIESDFTLPIEFINENEEWESVGSENYPAWNDITQYREAKPSNEGAVQERKGINETLQERGNIYGPFCGHAAITQALKEVMNNSVDGIDTNWDSLTASQKEALEMIAHKIGRILNGSPSYIDSWVDIAGYATLVVHQLEKDQGNEC